MLCQNKNIYQISDLQVGNLIKEQIERKAITKEAYEVEGPL